MPFVEMDAGEIRSFFTDVRILVNGISEYVVEHS
jgi:hypothetical protein